MRINTEVVVVRRGGNIGRRFTEDDSIAGKR